MVTASLEAGNMAITITLNTDNNQICFGSVAVCADVVFLMDSSGTIASDPEAYNQEKAFINDIIDQISAGQTINSNPNQGVRIGLILFSTEVSNEIYLRDSMSISAIKDKVRALRYEGGKTNIARALIELQQTQFTSVNGDRTGVQNIAILITDGKNEPSDADLSLDPVKVAREAKVDKQIEIITVGVTQDIDMRELEDIASRRELAFMSPSFAALSKITSEITSALSPNCDYVPITDPPRPPPTPTPGKAALYLLAFLSCCSITKHDLHNNISAQALDVLTWGVTCIKKGGKVETSSRSLRPNTIFFVTQF